MKKALITGITGQDGSYLSEFLLQKGYQVHGIKRRASSFNTQRIDHIYQDQLQKTNQLKLHYGDLTDSSSLTRIIRDIEPDEIYNLGAQSHVAVSFEAPEYTADVDAIGTLRILEAIRFLGLEKKIPILSGVNVRTIRFSPRNTSKRNNTILSTITLCSCKIICLLDLR